MTTWPYGCVGCVSRYVVAATVVSHDVPMVEDFGFALGGRAVSLGEVHHVLTLFCRV